MNATTNQYQFPFQLIEHHIRQLVNQPENGLVGLVDGLLELARRYRLQMEWSREVFRFSTSLEESQTICNLEIRPSVFRAI